MPAYPDLLTCRLCGHTFAAFTVDERGRCGACVLERRRRWAHRSEVRSGNLEAEWGEVRHRRGILLKSSDWTQLPDVPEATRAAWTPYRQALRDITSASSPDRVIWPQPPEGY